MKEMGFQLTTYSPTLSSILQLTPDEEILGYRTYAEFVVKNNMSSSPSVVMPFLQEMSKMVQPHADEVFKQIWDFNREKCVQSGDLEPWDEEYYTALMKSSAYNLDS